jgi:hypothetical protein
LQPPLGYLNLSDLSCEPYRRKFSTKTNKKMRGCPE